MSTETDQTAASPVDHLREAWAELTGPDGPFAIDRVEVRGHEVPAYRNAPPDLRVLWQLAAGRGDALYLVYEDEHYTYAEIDAAVRSLSHHLASLGVGRGDRVAIGMRNYPEWVAAYWATVVLGAAAVGMNAWWTTPEMDYALRDSAPKVLIVDQERLDRAVPILDDLRRDLGGLPVLAVRCEGDLPADTTPWTDVVTDVPAEAPDGLPDAEIDGDDDATVFYTSGTTGNPKGAQLTHRGCIGNILNIAFWTTAVGAAAAKGGNPADAPASPSGPPVFLGATPLFHVTACNCVLHPATLVGGTVVLMRRWDAGRALELIEREHVTNLSGVPTMSRELLAHPDWETRDTSSLVGLAGGGAPVPPDLVGKIDASLPKGTPTTGYGLTETCGIVTANSSRFYVEKPSSCGPVVPTLEAKLVDELGHEVPAGSDAIGELCVKGSTVIKGYLNRPEATAEAIVDGWFHTGDVARIDADGFVTIVDRMKDMVLRGGENVYCAEVEAAIHEHDDVREAAVFGVPDERLGEAVAAAVVVEAGSGLDAAGLQAFLDGKIATHKIPSVIDVRTEPLPRNANGKFLKRNLRDELAGASGT